MPYKTISRETAHRIGLLAERAGKLRAQADHISLQAIVLMREAGLDPERDIPVTHDGDVTFQGAPLHAGVVLRDGRPVVEDTESQDKTSLVGQPS